MFDTVRRRFLDVCSHPLGIVTSLTSPIFLILFLPAPPSLVYRFGTLPSDHPKFQMSQSL